MGKIFRGFSIYTIYQREKLKVDNYFRKDFKTRSDGASLNLIESSSLEEMGQGDEAQPFQLYLSGGAASPQCQ